MLDVNFYMKSFELQQQLMSGKVLDPAYVFEAFESYRSKNPVVYNIETTNACNMKCEMCPRTTMMTRPIETLDKKTFESIVAQIEPHSESTWSAWESFVLKTYGIEKNDMSENHFFLYIIPRVIQLHGYGDPLLDRNLAEYVKMLSKKGIQSYFSCNPANINIERMTQLFENGLNYIKYSIESVDDTRHKQIRGDASNFSESYKKIVTLLDIKKKAGYKATIIITMLDLNRKSQAEEFRELRRAFEGKDVYIYLKSEDQQWYRKDFHGTNSVHWSELCRHPWLSMTIKSNGEVAMCMEDFNNEIVLGNAKEDMLYSIWNGEKYHQFRKDHFDLTKGLKCTERCDMKLVGQFLQR